MVRPSQRREMARWAVEARGVSIRQACADFAVSETCYRYQRRLSDENARIADWLLRLTFNQKNWGFGMCYLYQRNVKRFAWNHKRAPLRRLPHSLESIQPTAKPGHQQRGPPTTPATGPRAWLACL